MHLGAQRLEPLLVRHAEVLLLVDDHQAEVLELDGLAEQRVGADHDVDLAVGDALLHAGQFGRRHEPRRLPDLHRKTLEPLGEGLGVLPRQQCGRHHHRHLLAAHHRGEGGAQRHFGLAEADVAADQPIHRTALAQIVEGRVDRGLLVVGFLVGKARGKFVGCADRDRQPRRFAKLPLGGDLDQLVGDLADAILHPRFARLPAGAAEPVELDVGVLRAVARQQLDVLDRQIELGVFGVVDFQAVVRRAGGLDVLQSDEAADAVIDMDDQIAGREAGHLGDEIVRALRRAARPHQPVAQNVLLADDGDVRGLETAFEAQHRERDLRLRQRQGLRP